MKTNKATKQVLEKDLEQRERQLQAHEEFDQVHIDDIAALKEFREVFGLKPLDLSNNNNEVSSADDESQQPINEHAVKNKAVTPDISSLLVKSRSGIAAFGKSGGSIGTNSLRSRISSNPSTLSPLYEEDHSLEADDDNYEDDSLSHDKMTKRVSKRMTMDDTQTTFDGVVNM